MDISSDALHVQDADKEMASTYFHSSFSLSPRHSWRRSSGEASTRRSTSYGMVMPNGIEPEAYAENRRCFNDPAAIHAACETSARRLRSILSTMSRHGQKIARPCWCCGARKGSSAGLCSVDLAGAGDEGLRQSSTRGALAPRGTSERDAGGARAASAVSCMTQPICKA